MIHCAFNICRNWCLFHNGVNNIKKYLEKNSYPKNFIDQEIKTYLDKQFNIEPPKVSNTVKFNYYKLPYIGHFSKTKKQKLKKICDQYCKDLKVRIVFTPFKVGDLFSVKDAIPKFLKSFVVYRLLCPGCIVFSSLKLRGGFLVFEIWTKRGVMKKLLRNRGCSLRKGGFQIVPSVFLQKSMFSLLAVINRSILSCGLLFTRK